MKILFDRSRSTTDWACPRRRYWNYDYNNRGIVPNGDALELFLGTVLHSGLSAIAGQQLTGTVDIDQIATEAAASVYEALIAQGANEPNANEVYTFAKEQSTLIEGLLRGFFKSVWSQLMAAFPTIGPIEQEMLYEINGLTFMAKPDLVLLDSEGVGVYLEYKSTSSKKPEWIDSWNTAVQLHSTVKAIEASTGIKVSNVIVQGLFKGYVAYGKQTSPFCYAYTKAANLPFNEGAISYEYKAGLKKFPVWELPGGIKKWVEEMPEGILIDQFPATPPIYINEALVDRFFAQRTIRESEIAHAKADIAAIQAGKPLYAWQDPEEDPNVLINQVLDTSFPQRFDQCRPAWGHKCPYAKLCFGPEVDPLEAGFQVRESHHAPEAEVLNEQM